MRQGCHSRVRQADHSPGPSRTSGISRLYRPGSEPVWLTAREPQRIPLNRAKRTGLQAARQRFAEVGRAPVNQTPAELLQLTRLRATVILLAVS